MIQSDGGGSFHRLFDVGVSPMWIGALRIDNGVRDFPMLLASSRCREQHGAPDVLETAHTCRSRYRLKTVIRHSPAYVERAMQ